MQGNRHLYTFVGCLCAGAVLAIFSKSQLAIVLTVLALMVLPFVLLALFLILNSLPAGQRHPDANRHMPQGLGSWPPPLLLAALASMLFVVWGGLDMSLARALYRAGSGFVGRGWLGDLGRFIGYMVPFLVLAVWLLSWIAERLGWPTPFSPKGRDVIFLTLSMIIGPGLIVNLGMKDHLHRPRPAHLSEFGGGSQFRAFYQFDGMCKKNCSFPSGEAAEAFWMMAPASLAPAPLRPHAMAGAIVFGVLVSALRLAFGGHFLSDVVFAALIMWAILLVLKRLIYPSAAPTA